MVCFQGNSVLRFHALSTTKHSTYSVKISGFQLSFLTFMLGLLTILCQGEWQPWCDEQSVSGKQFKTPNPQNRISLPWQAELFNGPSKNMPASCWSGQLCQSFCSTSLTLYKIQERIPLIQHYLCTGCLITFHREAAWKAVETDMRGRHVSGLTELTLHNTLMDCFEKWYIIYIYMLRYIAAGRYVCMCGWSSEYSLWQWGNYLRPRPQSGPPSTI